MDKQETRTPEDVQPAHGGATETNTRKQAENPRIWRAVPTNLDKEWVYGYPAKANNFDVMIVDSSYAERIDWNTLGQWTGATDMGGHMIFDGDLLGGGPDGPVRVTWNWRRCGFAMMTQEGKYIRLDARAAKQMQIVGHVFDGLHQWEGLS